MRTTAILARPARRGPLGGAGAGQARLCQAARHRQPGRVRGQGQRQGAAPARHRPRADDLPGRAVGRVRDRPHRRVGDGHGRAAEAQGRLAAARDALGARSTRCASRPTRRSSARSPAASACASTTSPTTRCTWPPTGNIRGYSFAPDSKQHRLRQGGQARTSRRPATSTRSRRWAARRPRLTDAQERAQPGVGHRRRSCSTASSAARATRPRTTSGRSTRRSPRRCAG